MPARVVELCDAIAEYVAAFTYSFTLDVRRANPAHYRLEDSPLTTLFVYAGPEGPTTATRNKWLHTYSATLQLLNYVDDQVGQSEIDNTFWLMEQIVDSLKAPRMAGMSVLEFSTEDNPEDPYVSDRLIQFNVAQSSRRAIYQELR